jgi:hypothetical protein
MFKDSKRKIGNLFIDKNRKRKEKWDIKESTEYLKMIGFLRLLSRNLARHLFNGMGKLLSEMLNDGN